MAFVKAVRRGDVEELQRLLAEGADVGAVIEGGTERTALHVSSEIGFEKVVKALVEAGADAAAPDHEGSSPLHLAAAGRGNAAKVVKVLLDAGANPNARDHFKRTPLHAAAGVGRDETVRILLKMGADFAATDVDGRTPRFLAEHPAFQPRGFPDTVAILVAWEQKFARNQQQAARTRELQSLYDA